MGEERRHDDGRMKEMHDDIKEIKTLLSGEQGICVRVGILETKSNSIQTELREHKEKGFRVWDGILAAGLFVLGLLDFMRSK